MNSGQVRSSYRLLSRTAKAHVKDGCEGLTWPLTPLMTATTPQNVMTTLVTPLGLAAYHGHTKSVEQVSTSLPANGLADSALVETRH